MVDVAGRDSSYGANRFAGAASYTVVANYVSHSCVLLSWVVFRVIYSFRFVACFELQIYSIFSNLQKLSLKIFSAPLFDYFCIII